MTNIRFIARFFISLIFLLSGINKIGNYEGTVGWMDRYTWYFFNPSNVGAINNADIKLKFQQLY